MSSTFHINIKYIWMNVLFTFPIHVHTWTCILTPTSKQRRCKFRSWIYKHRFFQSIAISPVTPLRLQNLSHCLCPSSELPQDHNHVHRIHFTYLCFPPPQTLPPSYALTSHLPFPRRGEAITNIRRKMFSLKHSEGDRSSQFENVDAGGTDVSCCH